MMIAMWQIERQRRFAWGSIAFPVEVMELACARATSPRETVIKQDRGSTYSITSLHNLSWSPLTLQLQLFKITQNSTIRQVGQLKRITTRSLGFAGTAATNCPWEAQKR